MSLSRLVSRLAFVAACSVGIGGCLSTPISSLPRLMRLDLATMDMDDVRAALRLPAMLRVRPGDAVMTIKTRVDGGNPTEDRFVLVESTVERERVEMAAEARAGAGISIWRIAPGDVPRVAAIQQRVRASLVQGPRVRGSLEIQVSGGCRTAPIPEGAVPMSSFLKPARGETYITLVSDLDLRRVIPLGDWQAKIPECGG
ncbi:hypothetical protein E8L99_21200 [Phreatobacter aquaticus]|uniref:Uncharacterized protein n=1 Tax=Phreatobacter aquaticus TaxID=2570229 RepID=A0A4D7QS78_9HYPH|nr:hypothetical protein [Phreatobacter aquaticus]QCK88094.1 hypothetical protein E8L99_21200 [Phreatobacter aquaticus]